ncbi:MAG: 2-oxo acid dehydrogenase subunit [Solirubrobacterales bacterium]|jgi:pyruvate dehydrogenase E2 component (dihydrolipoamide acetyltransferase)|nr:2-oxo acid dehydrogenase subunit [Solirubrobacterales bacterium]
MPAIEGQAGRGEPEVVKLAIGRRAMVRATLEGAAVPAFYLRLSADVRALLAARKALPDGPPSVNDLVVRAAALALRAHPGANGAYVDGEVHLYPRVNVGVAMAVPGGLVVPAVYDADVKDAYEISAAVRAAAELARRKKLTRELLADATFTVSNLGMFGIEDFDPIVNAPQAAILGVGAASADGRMRLSLGCDHRVLTGAEGAPFLATLRDHLEAPEGLLP